MAFMCCLKSSWNICVNRVRLTEVSSCIFSLATNSLRDASKFNFIVFNAFSSTISLFLFDWTIGGLKSSSSFFLLLTDAFGSTFFKVEEQELLISILLIEKKRKWERVRVWSNQNQIYNLCELRVESSIELKKQKSFKAESLPQYSNQPLPKSDTKI